MPYRQQWDVDLSPQQALFLAVYTQTGDVDAAMEAADYDTSPVDRQRFLMQAPVQRALTRANLSRVKVTLAQRALDTLERLMEPESGASPQVQFQTAKTICDMAGLRSEGPGAAGAVKLEDRPLTELSLSELEAYVTAGSAALQDLRRTAARTVDGDVIRSADSDPAQGNAQVWDGDDLSG
jgi:hypothetical protein